MNPKLRFPDEEVFLSVLSVREALTIADTRELGFAVHWLHDRGSRNLMLVDGDKSLTFSNGNGVYALPIPRVRHVLSLGR